MDAWTGASSAATGRVGGRGRRNARAAVAMPPRAGAARSRGQRCSGCMAMRVGDVAAIVLVLVVIAGVVAIAPVRRVLWSWLRRAWLARAWARAATDSGLADGPFRVPRVIAASPVAAGHLLRVRVLRGQSALALDARREELAACLRVRDVRIEREAADAADVRVTLVRRDPFEDVCADQLAGDRGAVAVALGPDPDRCRRARRVRSYASGRAQRPGGRGAGRGQVGRALAAGRRWRARPGGAGVAARRQACRAGGVGSGCGADRRA